jgi:hypothetical protein
MEGWHYTTNVEHQGRWSVAALADELSDRF